MLCFKNIWLRSFNIILFVAMAINFAFCYKTIPVKVTFDKPINADCMYYYNVRGNLHAKNVHIENMTYARAFLPVNMQEFAIQIKNKGDYKIDSVNIGGINSNPDYALRKSDQQTAYVWKNFSRIINGRKHYIQGIVLISFFTYLLLLITQELILRLCSDKNFVDSVNGYIDKIDKKHLKIIGAIVLVLLVFMFSINFLMAFDFYERINIDGAWEYALNKLNILPQFVFGRDVVFTYGPLGFLYYPLEYGKNPTYAIIFTILNWFVAFGLLLFNTFKFNKDFYRSKFIFLFLGLLFFNQMLWDTNVSLIFMLIILSLWFIQAEEKISTCLLSALAGFYCVLMLFLKFNSGTLALVLSVLLALATFVYKKKAFKIFAISYLTTFVISFTTIFLVYFKNFENFFKWCIGSISVASGYSDAMSYIGPQIYTAIALFTIGMYIFLLYGLYKRDFKTFIGAFLLSPFIFFLFKHGFVRQNAHMYSFFLAVPWAIGFLSFYVNKKHYKFFLSMFLVILISCSIYSFKNKYTGNLTLQVKQLFELNNLQQKALLDREEIFKDLILPKKWTDTIGQNSIQVLPYMMSYAEANHLTGWQPNPVLQLYQVYTQYLDNLSAKSFTKPDAAQFILLEFWSLEDRNMVLDNPATWNSIIPNYSVILHEGKFLLLKKNKTAVNLKFKTISSEDSDFNRWIKLPQGQNKDLYASFKIKESILGKILTVVFRGYPVYMEIKYKNGHSMEYRVIADTLKTPVLIDHIPNNINQLRHIIEHSGAQRTRVEKIRFINKAPLLFNKKISIKFMEAGI